MHPDQTRLFDTRWQELHGLLRVAGYVGGGVSEYVCVPLGWCVNVWVCCADCDGKGGFAVDSLWIDFG